MINRVLKRWGCVPFLAREVCGTARIDNDGGEAIEPCAGLGDATHVRENDPESRVRLERGVLVRDLEKHVVGAGGHSAEPELCDNLMRGGRHPRPHVDGQRRPARAPRRARFPAPEHESHLLPRLRRTEAATPHDKGERKDALHDMRHAHLLKHEAVAEPLRDLPRAAVRLPTIQYRPVVGGVQVVETQQRELRQCIGTSRPRMHAASLAADEHRGGLRRDCPALRVGVNVGARVGVILEEAVVVVAHAGMPVWIQPGFVARRAYLNRQRRGDV